MTDLTPQLDAIAAALTARRMSVNTESQLQAEIGAALAAAGIKATAEHRLAPASRIDFLAGAIGIEAKIKGSRLAVWRQLERYAAFEAIHALVLVGTVVMPAGIDSCGGKPFRFVSIGKGWL